MHHTVSNTLNGKCYFKRFDVDLNLSFFLFFNYYYWRILQGKPVYMMC